MADQRQRDWGGTKSFGVKHPSRNEPFFAGLGDHPQMAFPMGALLAQDNDGLPVERMIGIANLDPSSLMMGSMLSLRLPVPKRCLPISRAIPIGSRSPTAG
jgi:hypothetical protein